MLTINDTHRAVRMAFLCALCLATPAVSRSQDDARAVVLREGVVVDLPRGVAYTMCADSSIGAVDLARGAILWKTRAAANPVAIVGRQLVAQAEQRDHRLVLSVLDTRRGEQLRTATVDLPPDVVPTITDGAESSFRIGARVAGRSALLSWQHVSRARRALPVDSLAPGGVTAVVRRGAFHFDPETAVAAPAVAQMPDAPWNATLRTLARGERLTADSGAQFVSADDRHVVTSQRVADDRTWEKYRWVIRERAAGHRVGEIRSSVSIAPFLVHDSLVIYATMPYERRGAGPQPMSLRGIDVHSGRVVWSIELRETGYRGPMPPYPPDARSRRGDVPGP